MATFITTGTDVSSENKTAKGGVKTLYLADEQSIDSATVTGGVVSAIAMLNSETFVEFKFEEFTAELRESHERENGVSTWSQEIEIFTPSLSAANREAIMGIASAKGVVAVVELYSGETYFVGWDDIINLQASLMLSSDDSTSGKALKDQNGETIVLKNNLSAEKMYTTSVVMESPLV